MKFTTTATVALLSLGSFAVARQLSSMQNHQNYVPHKRSAIAEAYAYAAPEAYYGEADLFERDAYPEAYYEEYGVFERDAYPEAFYEDEGLFERDAFPEALYEEDGLFERDAEAEAEAEPEEWFDKEFYIFARDAEAEALAEAMALPWTPKIDVNGGKITKDTLKCNKKDQCSGSIVVQN